MLKNISYQNLSEEIKREVEKYHEESVKKGLARSMNDSLSEWFELSFEKWLIEKNSDLAGNKRSAIRLDIELPVHVAETLIENGDGATDEDDLLLGTIVNIGRGGLFFRSLKPIKRSSIVRVGIDLSHIDPALGEVQALAMVSRCEKISDNSFGIGLVFSSIYDSDQKKSLDMFIFTRLAFYMQNA